jgi:hypothetical protein
VTAPGRPVRRGITALVVALLVAIAVAAGVDSLRGESGPERAADSETELSATTSTSSSTGPDEPAAAPKLDGILYYTDEDCRLEAVRLPALERAAVPGWGNCHFVLSPDASSVSEGLSGWDPVGDFLFQLVEGQIVVTSGHEPVGKRFEGTAAAWRPDGTLTYADDGEVREWPSRRLLLSPDDLADAVRAHPSVPDRGRVLPVVVRALAWLDEDHAVAVISGVIGAGRETMLAFFEGRDLTAVQAGGVGRLSDLRVSPQGGFVSVRSDDGFLVLDRRGDLLSSPRLTGYRAIAWSPDERLLAVATDRGITLLQPGESSPVRRLSIVAHDLAWR